MNENYPWLPDLVRQGDYLSGWDEYFEHVYKFFCQDFIYSEPLFCGILVKSQRMESYDGKDHSFWHCIEEKSYGERVCEENRVPKIDLCERIRWPGSSIEHSSEQNVLVWREVYRGRGTKRRVHIYLPKERYVVVLDPRTKDEYGNPKYYFLWTTFLCEGPRQEQEMRKRYEKGEKIF